MKPKTQSQRLRAVIYRIYEQSTKDVGFEEYYQNIMEKIIHQMKERLNELHRME